MTLSNPKQVGISFATRRSPLSLRAHDLDAQQHTMKISNINPYRQALSLREMEASAGPHDRYAAESSPPRGRNTPIGGSDEFCDT
jgi:hypothetical protein